MFNLLINQNFIEAQYKIKKVVIDAGHGGKDPGAIGKKSKEKDIALAIALKLGQYIEEYLSGVKVEYTRKTDVFIELFKRAEIANKKQADVFISIHVNSNTSSKPYGTATYVMGLDKTKENLEVAQTENSVILKENGYLSNYKGFDPNSPDSYIVFSLLQNANLEKSLNLAEKVENQFEKRVGRNSRGVKQAALVVLWNATMPAILVETGFISNSNEEKYLMTDQGQSFIASAIFRAFRDYKNEIEKTSKNVKPITSNSNLTESSSKKESGVRFKVQIKSSSQRINLGSNELYGIKDAEEINFKGIYKYFVGNTESFKEILKIQNEVRQKVKDAFVVAFKNGNKIDIKEALEEVGRN
ncbi:MAG: N-acetylmuramoyl-L-alanine amidase [Bacteroidales bacterium]|nr:N-acetylmuramoyl-L-alanine amidase [Bacteroidales bacterium]